MMKRGAREAPRETESSDSMETDRGCACAFCRLEGCRSDGERTCPQCSLEEPPARSPGQWGPWTQLLLTWGFALPPHTRPWHSWGFTAYITQP